MLLDPPVLARGAVLFVGASSVPGDYQQRPRLRLNCFLDRSAPTAPMVRDDETST